MTVININPKTVGSLMMFLKELELQVKKNKKLFWSRTLVLHFLNFNRNKIFKSPFFLTAILFIYLFV